MSTVKVTNLQHASSASPNIVLDSSGNATMAGSMAMATPFAMKNKIINGAMEIDQRNGGAAQNNTAATATYCLDRYSYYGTTGARFSIGQNVGSVTPPPGFTNYLGISSLAATTPASTDVYAFNQRIEGLNIADLAWGSANAKTVTLSFWVRSSLTGTFGGVFFNSAGTRGYAYSYTINSANTWEYKTVTVPGDTTGTWLTTNGTGINIWFNFASGASQLKTPGVWDATAAYGPTGAVNVLSSVGDYLYITGVQLEVGTVATPFERRLFPQELAMCQRYLPVIQANPSGGFQPFAPGMVYSSSAALVTVPLWVTPRVPPSGVVVSAASDFACWQVATSSSAITGVAFNSATYTAATIAVTGMSGMTTGAATFMISNNTANAKMQFTGCEL